MVIPMLRAAFAALALTALLGGCEQAGSPATGASEGVAQAPKAHPSKAGVLVVNDANGNAAYTLVLDGSHAEVTVGAERYVGEQRGDKRRWRKADGSAFAEVKAKDDDFKLRTPDGALLWKVKLNDDKIKVSDNEGNVHPFVLKTGYEDKAKVLAQDESELGMVKFYGDRTKVKDLAGAERFSIDTRRRSAAFGVLLFEQIPAAHRAIIAAEIVARNR